MERPIATPPRAAPAPRAEQTRMPTGTIAPSDPATRRDLDEAAADEARRRMHAQGIVPIESDARIAVMLEPEEAVVTVRHEAALDRRQGGPVERRGLCGDLYVTTRRLVHLGRGPVAYQLADIREAVVVGDQLQLVVGDATAIAITVDDPRLLRVEIAAARVARAEEWPSGRSAATAADDGSQSSRR
jgi:hypothetical protein